MNSAGQKWDQESLKRQKELTTEECALSSLLSDAYDSWIKGLSGEEFVYKRFISTSLFRKHAFKSKFLLIIHVPEGSRAAYIDDISVYKGQYEVLIDRECCYRLLSIQGNIYEIEVEP